MVIVTIEDLCAHVGLTDDAPAEDRDVLQQKAEAAQNHVERMLGFQIAERFGGTDQEPVPPSLIEAVMQLAAWWFESREAVTDRDRRLPFGVDETVAAYRDWTF